MDNTALWLHWAQELQGLAQAGLYYAKDNPFDTERYTRIREIAAEMVSRHTELPVETVRDLFCGGVGYQTPKIDTRAAVIRDGRILLVKERTGRWALPGGWVDEDLSVRENAVKEVREEAGLTVTADRIVAVLDRKKHHKPVYAYNITMFFVACTALGGTFRPNSETEESGWFTPDALPSPLAEEKTTAEEIRMCFEAAAAGDDWKPVFD